MDTEALYKEFKSVSPDAVHLPFLSSYLLEGDEIWVQPLTGFVTSSRKMSEEDVVRYWSDVIFPDASEESYSAHFPFAQSRLLYVIETIAQFAGLNAQSRYSWGDFATGEGVLLELLAMRFPHLKLTATEHSEDLVAKLQGKGFAVQQRSLGKANKGTSSRDVDIATLTWTLANSIDPFAVLSALFHQQRKVVWSASQNLQESWFHSVKV